MATYIIRRVLAMIPALIGISLITFLLMHSTKGGPFTTEHSNPALTAALEKAYGLDKPLWPTFYGPDAATWQTLVGVIGLALLVAGIGLAFARRNNSKTTASDVVASRPASASVFGRQFAQILIYIGVVLDGWWLIMFLQGPTTRLVGGGLSEGQYIHFLWNLLHLDLGVSFSQVGQPVSGILGPAALNSLMLGLTAFIVLIGLSLPLGIIAALRQNTWVDYTATTFSLVGYSIPNFVLGIFFILFFGLQLGVLPIAGWEGPQYLVMPALVLAIRPMAVLTRLTRASMLEVLNQDYIRTAWSKGLATRVVLIRHALRNAMLPVVTVMGDQLGDLVTGSLVVETLFAVPGIGFYFVNSVNQRDYGVIMGTTVFYATLVLVINLVVDLLYGVIDPRVRLGASART